MNTRILTFLALALAAALPLQTAPASASATELVALTLPASAFEKTFIEAFEVSLSQMGLPEDKAKQVRAAALKLAKKVSSDEQLGIRMATVYTEIYTEAEIQELLTFYKTPIGKKSIEVMPVVFQKSALIGEELTQKHMADFQAEMISILSE